jgi:hypothetical protein
MITLRTLTCHRDVHMASLCLRTLQRCWQEPFKLIVHEDGSLTPEDREKLAQALPNIEILNRSNYIDQIEEVLHKFPAARKYRGEHPLSNKLLDIPIVAPETELHFVDCDLVFFRRFTGLFDSPGALFSREDDQGYCTRIPPLLKMRGPLASGFNSGLFRLPKGKYDLEVVEWFLAKEDLRIFPGLVEQTCFAFLFGVDGCYNFNTRQFVSSRSRCVVQDDTLSVHLMYNLKDRVDEFARQAEAMLAADHAPVQVQFQKVKQLSYMDLISRKIDRWRRARQL